MVDTNRLRRNSSNNMDKLLSMDRHLSMANNNSSSSKAGTRDLLLRLHLPMDNKRPTAPRRIVLRLSTTIRVLDILLKDLAAMFVLTCIELTRKHT